MSSLEGIDFELEEKKEVCISKKDIVEGFFNWIKQGQLENAAKLYHRCSEDIGYDLLQFAGKTELASPLGKVLFMAKDYYKAAQAFEAAGNTQEAAQLFEKAEVFESAAHLYGKLGNSAKAGEMAEQAGMYTQSADLFYHAEKWAEAGRNFAKTRQFFKAGDAYYKAGVHKKALEYLQKVEDSDFDYAEAIAILGPVLEEMSFPELALEKYKTICAKQSVNDENIHVFYLLACLHEKLAQVEEAKSIYSKVLERDMGFKDAQERYMKLKQGKTSPVKPVVQEPSPRDSSDEELPLDLVVLADDQAILEKCKFFNKLSFDEIRLLHSISEKRTLKTNESLWREGDPIPGVFVILKGMVKIHLKTEDQKNLVFKEYGAPEQFGEQCIMGERKGLATIFAKEESEFLFFSKDKIDSLLKVNPSLRGKMLDNLVLSYEEILKDVRGYITKLWEYKSK